MAPNQRHSLAFMPDSAAGAGAAGKGAQYAAVGIPQSRSYNDYYDVDAAHSGSVTPTGSDYESRSDTSSSVKASSLRPRIGIRPELSKGIAWQFDLGRIPIRL